MSFTGSSRRRRAEAETGGEGQSEMRTGIMEYGIMEVKRGGYRSVGMVHLSGT